MTSIWQWTRVCTIAALVVLYAPFASAQAPGEVDPHKDHNSQAAQQSGGDNATKPLGPDMMAGKKDLMARMAALDARIDTLVADMNMFGGELRISAMVSLLSALAERNKVMRDTMKMHEEMMGRMTGTSTSAQSNDDEAGMMCSMMKHKAAEPQP